MEFPLSLLDDPWAFADWQLRIGRVEARRQLDEACKKHYREAGVAGALEIGEKMDNCAAVLEEFNLGADADET